MPFSITGNLTSVLLNASNINIVSTSTIAFNQANFNTPRMVALFASGGIFKGIAYVRAWVSTTVLQLETPFFDPRTGLTVTQISGEQILVSKNFAESVVAGLAITGRNITISDACTFGTAGQQLSLCLFDMDYNISTNSTLTMTGGVVCFGKLTNYQNNEYSGAIDIFSTQGGGGAVLGINGSANAMFYGGLWSGINAPLYFSLGGNTGIFNSIECRADLVGGGSPENVQLINANLNSTTTNTILCRVATTKILGGRFRFPNNTSNTISVFGNDSAGNYIAGALPNKRMVFEDNGNARALVRAGTAVALNYDFTNFITQDFRSVTGLNTALPANPNGRNRFYFQDTYSNIRTGSVAIFLNSSGNVEQSNLNSGTIYEPILHRKTCTGATVVDISTGWTYGFKRYGFEPTGGVIAPSLYNMGVLGFADNVSFGGLVNQVADTGVTLSNANALLLASKFTISTASNGTVTVNSATTLDELYDYLQAWNCQTIANAQFPTISTSPIIANGDTLSTNMTIIGLNFLAKGTKFKKITANATQTVPTNLSNVELIGTLTYNTNTDITVTFTNCNIGTVTNAGTGIVTVKNINTTITALGSNVSSYVPTFLNLTLNGGRIRILNHLGVEQFNQTTDGLIELPSVATGTWTYRIAKFGNLLIDGTFAINGTTQAINASFIPDANVVDTLANVQAYTDLDTLQKIYDYESFNLTTATGIVIGKKLTKGSGTLSVDGGLTLGTGAMFDYSSNFLTVNCSEIVEESTVFATGNFTQGSATLGNDVKIRALNFDSEIIYTADNLKFYPTILDRDNNTNIGTTSTGGVYRYKFGAVYAGVTMTNPLVVRYALGVTTSLASLPIVTGQYVFVLQVESLLLSIQANQKKINNNVIKSSKFKTATEIL